MRQNVVVMMSLSGTLVVVLYILITPLLARYVGVLWRYRFLKMALLFYLLPFPLLKYRFISILRQLSGYERIHMAENVPQILNRTKSILIGPDNQVILPNIAKQILIAALLIASCSLVIILLQVYRYFKVKHILMKCGPEIAPSNEVIELLTKLKKEIKLDRYIKLVLSPFIDEPMVLGFVKPVILLPNKLSEWDEDNLYYIIKHELIHIKNRDLSFKFWGLITLAVHWFNPFCIYLFKELSDMAEICCDKQVIAKRNENDVKIYGTLLIEMATSNRKKANDSILFKAGLIGNGNSKMKRRIKEMKKKEHVSKVFILLVLVSVFNLAFATAVFAYNPIDKMEVGNTYLNPHSVNTAFIPGEVKYDIIEDFTRGGDVFVEDKTGTVYDMIETEPKISCKHDFVNGTNQDHVDNSNGSCRVDYYYAQRCSICGYVKLGDKYKSVIYDVCPH